MSDLDGEASFSRDYLNPFMDNLIIGSIREYNLQSYLTKEALPEGKKFPGMQGSRNAYFTKRITYLANWEKQFFSFPEKIRWSANFPLSSPSTVFVTAVSIG